MDTEITDLTESLITNVLLSQKNEQKNKNFNQNIVLVSSAILNENLSNFDLTRTKQFRNFQEMQLSRNLLHMSIMKVLLNEK